MKKRIVICADGTWSRPEIDIHKDKPTNTLKIARAIKPYGDDQHPQQVFYDWGVGSYTDPILGGAIGQGMHKNIMDNYRYIVQNYSPGDELFLFGFSRGAYTVRSLSGLINNCGIIKRPYAQRIQQAFDHYKNITSPFSPQGEESIRFREQFSHASREIQFIGVWDTIGSMGIPMSFLGLFDDSDEFYNTKIGGNVVYARHALAIDEHRSDYKPTIWKPLGSTNLKQVWFAGSHSDIGGTYVADCDTDLLSDISLTWMIKQAQHAGLTIEQHLSDNARPHPLAPIHDSRRRFYRMKKKYHRPIVNDEAHTLIHKTVKERWDQDPQYRPHNLKQYIDENGWPNLES